jgi:hypothetical protein
MQQERLTASRLHRWPVMALVVGQLVALGGCSILAETRTVNRRSCTLEAYSGSLMARGSGLVFTGGRWGWTEVEDIGVSWPDGWSTRGAVDGQIEVLKPDGSVAARSGAAISLFGLSVGGNETIRDGKFVTCDPPF